MSPIAVNSAGIVPAMTPLPVTGPPALFMLPFKDMYNPGAAACGSGWDQIGAGNTYAGYCDTTAALTQQASMLYGGVALAALVVLPGWWKVLAVVPAFMAFTEGISHSGLL